MAEGKLDVRVLSIWQPWASLLANRLKQIETRPAKTSHIGPGKVYLIQAGMKWSKWQYNLCLQEPFLSSLRSINYPNGFPIKNNHAAISNYDTSIILPLGHIVGSMSIVECSKIYNTYDNHHYWSNEFKEMLGVREPELSFGDYSPGRYAWLTQNTHACEPLPYKGAQGYYQKFKGNFGEIKFFL